MERLFLFLASLAVTVAVIPAFTAGNNVPKTKAGDGAGRVTSYVISNVLYTLNTSDPQKVDSVTFTLDSTPPPGATVRARLTSTGTTWYTCTASGPNVTCDTRSPSAAAASSDQLQVIIAD